MKTMFVTIDAAFPPVSGADLRNWQNATAARALGSVQLLSIGRGEPTLPPPGISVGHLAGLSTDAVWSDDFDVRFPVELVANLRAACQHFQPDVIILESLPLAGLIAVATECAGAVVIDLHNIESHLAGQDPAAPGAEPERSARVARLAGLEAKAAAKADRLWCCSDLDRSRLARNGIDGARIDIVPNGIPRPDEAPNRLSDAERHPVPTLLFSGHLHYPPNIEAAHALIDLMPRLIERLPEARLLLAGRNPAAELRARADGVGVELIADPASMAAVLSRAGLAVMPLARGGGTRIKALEAMAWGLPLVATRRAVEGLDLRDGVDVWIADTPADFIEAICALLADDTLYADQARRARHRALTEFGPDAIRAAVAAAFAALPARRH